MQQNLSLGAVAALVFLAPAAQAGDYVLTLKDHAFSPQPLNVPAGQKIRLVVKNLGAAPAEFESSDLDREKVVGANDQITVFIGPLEAGSYGYFNDFDRSVTGTIVAK